MHSCPDYLGVFLDPRNWQIALFCGSDMKIEENMQNREYQTIQAKLEFSLLFSFNRAAFQNYKWLQKNE